MLAAYFVAYFISSFLVHGREGALTVAPHQDTILRRSGETVKGDGSHNITEELHQKIKHLEHNTNNLQDQLNTFQQRMEELLERTESREACFKDLESANCTGSQAGSVGIVEAIDALRVDGGWGHFSDWSECSATCGGGVQFRNRACNNPSPQYGGRPCMGAGENGRKCNVEPCCTEGFTRFMRQCLDCVREDNIGYNSNDLVTGRRYVKTDDAHECAKWCGVAEGCKFWTFVKSTKDCWLKHSNSGRPINSDAISGTKGCASAKVSGGAGVPVRTLSSSGYGNNWNSHFAIDGLISTTSQLFFHSAFENYPWLQIELSIPTEVSNVTIVNRKDCCVQRLKNVEIRAGMNEEHVGTNTQLLTSNTVCATFQGPPSSTEDINLRCETPIMAKFITIQLKDEKAILQINEFRINKLSV